MHIVAKSSIGNKCVTKSHGPYTEIIVTSQVAYHMLSIWLSSASLPCHNLSFGLSLLCLSTTLEFATAWTQVTCCCYTSS